MASIALRFPGLPPSANKRLHHMERYRSNNDWKGDAKQLAADAVNRSKDGPFPWDLVHVHYLIHYPKRTKADLDNMIGSCKPVLDGLSGVVFTDDSSQHVHRLSAEIVVQKGEPAGLIVSITRCDRGSLHDASLDN